MAREEKRVELRPVEEATEPQPEVIRLHNSDTAERAAPIRLTLPPESNQVAQRLDLPSRETELRTYQPGVEALIDIQSGNIDALERDWGEEARLQKNIPWGWFALIGLLLAGGAIWSLSRVNEAEVQAADLRETTQSVLAKDTQADTETSNLLDRMGRSQREFFQASHVDKLSRYVRQPERVIPLMRKYYAEKSLIPRKIHATNSLQPLTLDGQSHFWMSSVELEGHITANLILDVSDPEVPRIDWETYVCYQPMEWDRFALNRPAGTTYDFRVYVEIGNLYSHEFTDASKWSCFRLTALDSDETLFGYAKKADPVTQDINHQLAQNQGAPAALILRLSLPEGLQSRRGVMIEKMLSPQWIYLTPPDSGS